MDMKINNTHRKKRMKYNEKINVEIHEEYMKRIKSEHA
jgi:hypothetical protein